MTVERYTAHNGIIYFVSSPANHEAAVFRSRSDRGENRYTLRVQTAWASRFAFEKDMIGWHENVAGKIVRFLPEPYFEAPKARCTSLRMVRNLGEVSQDPFSGYPSFERAEYEATFEAKLYEYATDEEVAANTLDYELIRYVDRRETAAIESISIKGHGYKYHPANASLALRDKPVPEPGQKTFFSKRLQYIWHCVPGYPNENIKYCAGKVNATTFDHGNFKAEAETMLFWGVQKDPIADDINPIRLYTITYEFLWRPDTWNKIYSSVTGLFEPVVLATDDTKKPYDTALFNSLFTLKDEVP